MAETAGVDTAATPGAEQTAGPMSFRERIAALEGPPGRTGVASAAPQKKDDVAAAQAAKDPVQQQRQEEARRIKLKLGDTEEELDESVVVAGFKRGQNAQRLMSEAEKRRQEAFKVRTQAEALLERIKSDPRGALRELGVDLTKMSEEEILEQINLEKMTPAERALYEREQKIKAKETEVQKAEREKQEAADNIEFEKHRENFAGQFMDAMEKVGLPKASGRHVVRHMADLYEELGGEVDADTLAAHVMAKLAPEHQAVMGGLEGEALLSHLGEETVKKVVRAHLARIKGGQKPAARAAAPAPKLELPGGKGAPRDIFRQIQNLK